MNTVNLIGNLTRDPELSYTPANVAVCKLGLALNRKWRDRDGNDQEEVSYIDVTAFGKQAETLSKYVAKGAKLGVTGRLKQDRWQAQDGSNRSLVGVILESFTFFDSKRSDDNGQQAPLPQRPKAQVNSGPVMEPDDDIPF